MPLQKGAQCPHFGSVLFPQITWSTPYAECGSLTDRGTDEKLADLAVPLCPIHPRGKYKPDAYLFLCIHIRS
jgi:hypothetical protein